MWRDNSPRCGVVRHGRRIHGLLHRGRRVRDVTEAGRLLANFGHFLFTSGSKLCSQGSTAMHFLRHVVRFLFVSFLLPRLLPPRTLRSVPSLGPPSSLTTCSQPSVPMSTSAPWTALAFFASSSSSFSLSNLSNLLAAISVLMSTFLSWRTRCSISFLASAFHAAHFRINVAELCLMGQRVRRTYELNLGPVVCLEVGEPSTYAEGWSLEPSWTELLMRNFIGFLRRALSMSLETESLMRASGRVWNLENL